MINKIIPLLEWSNSFESTYSGSGLCSLCQKNIKVKERIQILLSIKTERGKTAILAHTDCLSRAEGIGRIREDRVKIRVLEFHGVDTGDIDEEWKSSAKNEYL